MVPLLRILRFLFAWSNEKCPVHSNPLQHVLRVVSRQFFMKPLFPKVAVLLRDRVT